MLDPQTDYIIVGDAEMALVEAVKLRRQGISVFSFFAGSENKQRKKAAKWIGRVISIDQAREL